MSEATPRITQPMLEQFSHQTVRVLGKVRQLRGEQATIDAGGQITIYLTRVRDSCTRMLVVACANHCDVIGFASPAQSCGGDHREGAE
jgi:replication factor A3